VQRCSVHGLRHTLSGGILEPVSLLNPAAEAPAGAAATQGSDDESGGRYVLFASTANNLVLTSSNTPLPVLFRRA